MYFVHVYIYIYIFFLIPKKNQDSQIFPKNKEEEKEKNFQMRKCLD